MCYIPTQTNQRIFVKSKHADIDKTNQITLRMFLPLPPSKNIRWKTKGYYDKRLGKYVTRQVLSDDVLLYRVEVNRIVSEQLRKTSLRFTNSWLHIHLVWRVPNLKSDVINYHQDLADAIQEAINTNDKWYLLHDNNVIVDKDNPGVEVTIIQDNNKSENKTAVWDDNDDSDW